MLLNYHLANGERVSAPTEAWVAAIISLMTDAQREAVIAKVKTRISGPNVGLRGPLISQLMKVGTEIYQEQLQDGTLVTHIQPEVISGT